MPNYQDDLTASQNNLANLYRSTGRDKEAEAAYQATLAVWKFLAKTHPDVPSYQQDLALIHNNLGIFYSDKGRDKEAEAAHLEALSVRKLLVKRHPDVPKYQERSGSHLQ